MNRSKDETRDVYNTIADHFSETRANPWPEVMDFIDGIDAVQTGIDIGCGNGRHLNPLANKVQVPIGIDVSEQLLKIAQKRVDEATLLVGDATRLPLAAGSVDAAIYVATIHHLPTAADRLQSLNEIARILQSDGTALVSAWSTEHSRFDKTESFDTTLEWTLPDGEIKTRFFHIYSPADFKRTIEESALELKEMEVSSGNCYATVGTTE
ncbi:methyltransferase domain-containing protein [Salinarchaeum sp. IM2453]|uniref:class I SAM-dependent methyltransferase n=1 Tax=Salinarchaeum sp. IM2453 TaxID=2862870 RepID=UPI001C82FDBC|nr:class I SAM-dependent methyltransferase [Salinarchaeum sp. IM2453]QZA87814.1 methyltransferase domain-containing protein [Salinarchaeum sp. IM2453]